jgi:hypothetical protein
VNIGKTI